MGDEFDLQSQLDNNLGSDYQNDNYGNTDTDSANYLQNQNWDFGNYGDQWSNMTQPQNMGQWSNELPTGESVFSNGQGIPQGYQTPQGQYQQYQGMQSPMQQNVGSMLVGAQNALANIFNSKQGMTGLGALIEGYQNKKRAANLQQIVSQNKQMIDPFGSQRGIYQQELAKAVQDPYSAPIVKDQVAQLQAAQARKDAAAGRRSNSATSDPALLAASAKVAQDYINSLYTPSGANISPNGGQALQMLGQAGNYSTNGYLSPLMSSLGYNSSSRTLDELKKFLQGG